MRRPPDIEAITALVRAGMASCGRCGKPIAPWADWTIDPTNPTAIIHTRCRPEQPSGGTTGRRADVR